MRYTTFLALVFLSGCSGVTIPAQQYDGGVIGDAAPSDAPYTGCEDVATAYEAARMRLGCSYDWGRCPTLATNAECVAMFESAPSCGALDSFASTCSRLLP